MLCIWLPYLYALKCIHMLVASLCSLEQEEALGLVLVIPNVLNDSNQERKKLARSAGITAFFILLNLWSHDIVFMRYGERTQ